MMDFNEDKIQELANKYQSRLSSLETENNKDKKKEQKESENRPKNEDDVVNSRDYVEFKKQFLPPELSRYEQLCKQFGGLFKVNPSTEEKRNLEESISYAHLNVTPEETLSFAYVFPLLVMFVGSFLSFFIFRFLTGESSLFFPFVAFLVGFFLMNVFKNVPHILSEQMIMKAGSSMIQAIFYVVTFMRSTSNFELSVNFAAEHLPPPLSLDFKKVLWDVENGKYNTVKESMDDYLVKWRGKSDEFIEAMHMVESSLYEGNEERRVEILDKSLHMVLDGNYNKMMRFARDLKNPIAMLNMMGVVMPILGLVILPMVVSFMDSVSWYHISTLYNFLLPAGIAYYARTILLKRPAASTGSSDINVPVNVENNFSIGGFDFTMTPFIISLILGSLFILIGISPLIMNAAGMNDIVFSEEFDLKFLDYQVDPDTGKEDGPYGIGATVISLSAVIGVGILVGLNKKLKSDKPYKLVEKVKKLEDEFSSSIYQLANRLGEGVPLETAFQSVIASTQGSATEEFYSKVNDNIKRLGMSVNQALYDPEYGALKDYPSPLMHSSMKILIESIKKGPRVASKSLVHISKYSESIKRVNERLKDLMAEVISSIKSQISMMAPVISAIVVGITSMIISIIGRIRDQVGEITAETGGGGAGMGLIDSFQRGVPAFYFQIVIGIYVVTLIAILSKLIIQIENGPDKVLESHEQAKNIIRGTVLYSLISFFTTLGFNILAATIMTSI
ncbi:MAG: hypothetical protein ACOCRX_00230 [Candidatus Woesearchaeota archaeon]